MEVIVRVSYPHGAVVLFMLGIMRVEAQGVHEFFLGDSRADGGHCVFVRGCEL